MVAEWLVLVAVGLGGIAELLHARRVRRVQYLAFGARGRPRPWLGVVPVLRVLGASCFLWGSIGLLRLDAASMAGARPKASRQRLVLLLDSSTSMGVRDGGTQGQQTRGDRARQLIRDLFRDVGASRPVTLIAFFDQALPVVLDTLDHNVILNILDRLPLEQAFKSERPRTDLFGSLAASFELMGGWGRGSVTLAILTDGDSIPGKGMPVPPPAVGRVLVVGLGSTSGRFVDGHSSAQHVGDLRNLADRVRGQYFNGNSAPLPPNLLSHLRDSPLPTPTPESRLFRALLWAMAVSAIALSLLPAIIALGTSSRAIR